MQFYQRQISAWMDGTEGLTDGEYRVYDVVCNLIYLADGPIVLHESGFAGRCNQHTLRFRRNFESLVTKGKLIVQEDGKIANKRVLAELEKVRRPKTNPRRTLVAPSNDPRGVEGGVVPGSSEGSARKPLKNNNPTLFDDRLDNRREEDIDSEAKASARKTKPVKPMTALEIERKELFDRGKVVLGEEAGGMIQKLLATKHGNIALARAAIEQASTMDDPRSYVGGILRAGGTNGTDRNGGPKLGYAGLAEQVRRASARPSAGYQTAGFGDAGDPQPSDGRRHPATGNVGMERSGQAALPPPPAERR